MTISSSRIIQMEFFDSFTISDIVILNLLTLVVQNEVVLHFSLHSLI
jgi:hypothetical protein